MACLREINVARHFLKTWQLVAQVAILTHQLVGDAHVGEFAAQTFDLLRFARLCFEAVTFDNPANAVGSDFLTDVEFCRLVFFRFLRLLHVNKLSIATIVQRSEEHTSELQSRVDLVCRLLLEKKKKNNKKKTRNKH